MSEAESHAQYEPEGSAARLDAGLIRGLFARPVGIGIRRVDDGRPAVLLPEEALLLSDRASEKRRRDLALGRAAAHDALAEIGLGGPVLRGDRGAPRWPAAAVGSITHSGGLAIAVVAHEQQYAGIGIDLEQRVDTLTDAVAALVCTPAELAWAAATPEAVSCRRATIFSAKEALFKALFPLTGVWFDYLDAELTWSTSAGCFIATLLRPLNERFGAGFTMPVSSLVTADGVLSAASVERS